MAQQGKKVLLIGCDPKSDTTSLLFGGRACPTIIETRQQEEAGWRGGEHRRRLLQARRRLRDGARRARGRPRLRRARHHPRLRDCWRSWASTTGASTTCCSTSWATWSAAASACRLRATCARRSSSSAATTCSRCTWPTTSATRSSTSASSAATSAWPAWSSTRTTAPARRRPLPRVPASRCWPPFPPTTTSAARAPATKSSAARHAGARCSRNWHQRGRGAAHAPRPLTQDQLLGLFSADVTGRDVVLEPATQFDMCGERNVKQSLEVVYDEV
jgi:hypothetical protein